MNNGPSGLGKNVCRSEAIAQLQRDIDALGAQRQAKERDLQRLTSEPKSLLDLFSQGARPQAVLRPAEKIALFLELFGARRDVYAKFWENLSLGKKGYSPATVADAAGRRFLPLGERVVERHLLGSQAIGVYALRTDDSCLFLAADFDGEGWRENVLAYQGAAQKAGVSVAIERSRSGNGAHAWIFFVEPVPAFLARRLGTILLAKASAMRPTKGRLSGVRSTADSRPAKDSFCSPRLP